MKSKHTNGCGCGGNCGPGPCDCTVRDASCGCQHGVLVRPRFFSGQLLTDDDLQALTNYVVNSRRLHNKFLVGSGVSCGLAVTCHPCGGGRVIVQAGHAVDCCGNEIMVPCPVELDINGMVRDLKYRMLGHDCGDPCADDERDPNGNFDSNREIDPVTGAERERFEHRKTEGKQYCLYVRYCETHADPVAPYTQDDKCAVTCEPSRVNEGYEFELRCPTDEPDPPSIMDRLECCFGQLEEADRKASDFERVQYQVRQAQFAQTALDGDSEIPFSDADRILILEAEPKLALRREISEEDESRPGIRTNLTRESDELAVRRTLDDVFAVSAATVRFYKQSPDFQAELLEQAEFSKALETNRSLLLKLAPELSERSQLLLKSPIEQSMARAVSEAALTYTDSDPAVDRESISANHLALNSVYDVSANSEHSEALRKFKAWLLRKLDECPPTGQCCLAEEVASIVVPTGDSTEALWSATEKLAIAYLKFLLDCICSALLPPCPPCDDEAVKLACLEVVDCKVTNICNLERTFLLTENNLRYWIPLIHQLGEALERVCCEFPKNLFMRYDGQQPRDQQQPQLMIADYAQQQTYFSSGRKTGDLLTSGDVYPNILRLAGLSQETFAATLNAGSAIGRVALREPSVTTLIERSDVLAAKNLGGMLADGLVQRDTTKAVLAEAAKDSIRSVEGRLDLLAEEGMRFVEETETKFNDRLADIDKRIGDRLTSRSLSSAKPFKDMTKKLEEVMAENLALAKRLEAIEKETK
jgi:hypothetical protein